jgi:TPR repeat protein
MLGLAYERGLGVPLDPERATVTLRKACALSGDTSPEACKAAMQMFQALEVPSVPKPPK